MQLRWQSASKDLSSDICASRVTIAPTAVVQGAIYADDAIIRGRVEGGVQPHQEIVEMHRYVFVFCP